MTVWERDPNLVLLVVGLVLAFGSGLGIALGVGSSIGLSVLAAVGVVACFVAQHRMAKLPDE